MSHTTKHRRKEDSRKVFRENKLAHTQSKDLEENISQATVAGGKFLFSIEFYNSEERRWAHGGMIRSISGRVSEIWKHELVDGCVNGWRIKCVLVRASSAKLVASRGFKDPKKCDWCDSKAKEASPKVKSIIHRSKKEKSSTDIFQSEKLNCYEKRQVLWIKWGNNFACINPRRSSETRLWRN